MITVAGDRLAQELDERHYLGSDLSARIILAEIGRDMGRFPTQGHLISWAGLCPKNDESAGKRAIHAHA